MNETAIFSICAKNYLPYVRVLMQSVAQFESADRYVGIADILEGEIETSSESFNIIELDDLDLPNIKSFAFRYEVTEFNTAIKPWLFRYLFGEGYDHVIYLDPDIKLLGQLQMIHEALDVGARAVLTPHLLSPVTDDAEPNDLTILRTGTYNLGFCAMRRGEQIGGFLNWWCFRLEHQCLFNRLEDGIFVDQKWIDLLPGFVDDVTILRDPGYNVAYWNLVQRTVEKTADGWRVNGRPLTFFHFSGVIPGNQKVFSKHQSRFHPQDLGDVKELFTQYLEELEEHGIEDAQSWDYAFGRFNNRARITGMMRHIFREELEPVSDDPFDDWEVFNEPDPRIRQFRKFLITRLMYRVWLERPDAQQQFSLSSSEGRHAFVNWFLNVAKSELELDDCFIQPVRERFVKHEGSDHARYQSAESVVRRTNRWVAEFILFVAPKLRVIHRHFPDSLAHRVRNRLLRRTHVADVQESKGDHLKSEQDCLYSEGHVGHSIKRRENARGVKLIGYAKAEMGVGQGVRMHARALEAVGANFSVYSVSAAEVYRQEAESVDEYIELETSADVNIFHINADQVPPLFEDVPGELIKDAYNIGYWAWELSRFPQEWLGAFDYFNEIWVPSHFTQEAVSRVTEKPVIVMPHAIERQVPGRHDRMHFGLDERSYLFLSTFDFNSFVTRKNPEAVVRSFEIAFPKGDESVQLMLKAQGGDNQPKLRNSIEGLAARDHRIRFMNGVIDQEELIDLQSQSDCLVSLHRSEGFGLNIAECMALGKPVIVTDYSGNRSFVDISNGCPVRYKLVEVAEGEYPFGVGCVWADADCEHAAEWMKCLYDNRMLGDSLGACARESIQRNFSPEAVGKQIVSRLVEIGRL